MSEFDNGRVCDVVGKFTGLKEAGIVFIAIFIVSSIRTLAYIIKVAANQ